MRNLLLCLALLFIPALGIAQTGTQGSQKNTTTARSGKEKESDATQLARHKKDFIKTCVKEAGEVKGEMRRLFREYCECSAEKMYARYTQKDIVAMETEAKRTGSRKAMEDEIRPVVQPCLDELISKAADLNAAKSGGKD